MKVCVQGLWHLGTVTAACLASQGFDVTGLDEDKAAVAGLSKGTSPVFEPGLDGLIRQGIASGKLSFTADAARAAAGADIVWAAFDTPVDDKDEADSGWVERRVRDIFPHLSDGAIVLVSSQVPVGTTKRLESAFRKRFPGKKTGFCYSPENLVLGKAIEAFTRPARVVVGTRDPACRPKLEALFSPAGAPLLWMSVESAEMAKHALNCFLAASIAFANEIAVLCERTEADASDVEKALRTDPRVGPKAYLRAGGAFAGGTLGRDLGVVRDLAKKAGLRLPLLESVSRSNEAHKTWAREQLLRRFKKLAGRRIAVLGLTYKPGTDTLRRSEAIALSRWLGARGAEVTAYDPRVKKLPPGMPPRVRLAPSCEAALRGAHAAVIATEWEDFKNLRSEQILSWMPSPVVIDPGRFLGPALEGRPGIEYASVGRSR